MGQGQTNDKCTIVKVEIYFVGWRSEWHVEWVCMSES